MSFIEETVSFVVDNYFWFNLLGLLIGAVACIAAATVVFPSIVDHLQPPSRMDKFSDYLPYERMLPDGKTIECSGNTYIRILEIKGAELNLAGSNAENGVGRAELFFARKYMLDEIHKHGVSELKFFQIKAQKDIEAPPKNKINVIQNITNLWMSEFKAVFQLRTYLIVSIRTKNTEDLEERFDKAVNFIKNSLTRYDPIELYEPINAKQVVSPERRPLAVLGQLASPIGRPKPLGRNYIDRVSTLLTTDIVSFKKHERNGIMKFKNGEREKYAAIIGIRDCGDKTPESVMQRVISLPIEMNIFQMIVPHDPTKDGVKLMIEKRSAPFMRLSQEAVYEIDDALSMISGQNSQNRATLHDYALSVIVYGDTPEHCMENQTLVETALTSSAATTVRETLTSQATFFSQFGGDSIWPRKFRFMSQNVAANLYLQKPSEGLKTSNWIQRPLAWLKTVDGQPYAFQLHSEESNISSETGIDKETVAHGVVIGPTGSGKTVFMSFIAAMATSIPDMRVYMFDRLNGCQSFVKCAGGEYITFGESENSASMNPLLLNNTESNKAFLRRWLQLLDADLPANRQVNKDISRLIDTIYDPNVKTSLKSLRQLAGTCFESGGKMREAVAPWIEENGLGHYFNAPVDTLDLKSNRIIGLDMTDILLDAKIAPLVIDYVTHRIRDVSIQTNYAPSMIFIDETAPMLSASRRFAENFVRVGLNEGRKVRQAVIVTFQTPNGIAALEESISAAIRQMCMTLYIFPNPNTKREDYASFNLTDGELDYVTGKTHQEFPYSVLIKKVMSGESAIINIDLSVIGKYMKVFASGGKAVTELNHCIDRLGKQNFVDAYLNGTFSKDAA